MLYAICAKWNLFPYTARSNLCPASFLHRHSIIQDIVTDSDSKAITEVMREVMKEVTDHAYERVLGDSGLDRGPEKNEIKEGHIVAWNKSEDAIDKGLLFGRVEEQEGSDYLVKVSNNDIIVILPKQPQTAPFELVEEEEAKMATDEVKDLDEEVQ